MCIIELLKLVGGDLCLFEVVGVLVMWGFYVVEIVLLLIGVMLLLVKFVVVLFGIVECFVEFDGGLLLLVMVCNVEGMLKV